MTNLENELRALRATDQDVASVMDAYAELEQVYRGALEAMGLAPKSSLEITNTAQVVLSFSNTPSTATGKHQ
jgi:hypothetical protein